MSDTPAVEQHDLVALRAEVDQLRVEIAEEKQRQAAALSVAENDLRAQRLQREREDLRAELERLRAASTPGDTRLSEPEQPAEIPPPPIDPVTLRALPVDPDRPDPNVVADATVAEGTPEASTDTATKRR